MASSAAACHRATSALVGLGLAFFVLLLPGCDSESRRLEAISKQAQSNRSGAAAEMVAAWRARKVTLNAAINLAHDRVRDPETSAQAVRFDGAVLDAAAQTSAEAARLGVNEFYWERLGRLAFWSANAAREAGDVPLARSLVLAGPKRWQTEAYWRRHPDHDALAACILYESGEAKEAVARLRSRAELQGQAKEAFDQIQEAIRSRPAP